MADDPDVEVWDDGGDGDADAGWSGNDNKDDEWGGDAGSWDDGAADVKSSIKPVQLTRQTSCHIVSQDVLKSRKQQLIDQAAELLFVSKDEADCLLRHFGWELPKLETAWLADSVKLREKVGVRPKSSSTPLTTIQCSSAFCDAVPVSDAYALNCGHWFCNDCWYGFMEAEMKQGRSVVFAKCPGMACKQKHNHVFACKCNEMIPASAVTKFITDPQLQTKYFRWVLDDFVKGQRSIKWCPNPSCGELAEYDAGGSRDVDCKCGRRWCFRCSGIAHCPAPCDLASKWIKKQSSDEATEVWLNARTKECPNSNCKVRIEKNKACNHMTCSRCKHQFCWLCKGPWAEHGSSTGGYYVCQKFNESKEKGKQSDEEKNMANSQHLLQKYTYYYTRFKSSEDSIKLTDKLRTKFINEEVNKVGFVMEAISKLIDARRVLQWTYCMDYYIQSGKVKELFEYQQDLLVDHTEQLQHIVEENSELEKLIPHRKRIIDLTSSLDRFRRSMVQQVEDGKFDTVMLDEPDAVLKNWACTVCSTAHDDPNRKLCSSCGACRIHGEQDCRGCNKQN